MNPPMDDIDLKPEKLEEQKDSSGPLFHCDLCDTDIVHKIAQAFLPGLASACIDNTTGGLFKSPVSVAVDIRREMVDYLIQRSESFVAESVVLEGGPGVEASENPYDNISDFVDDFVTSKRNFFSRVSGWLLSERREDRIDDLVQEMEINGFWLLSRRSSVAQTLLKNVDFKSVYHCSMSFKSREDLEVHKLQCSFRTLACANEGCDSSFSAGQMDHHDSVCPFKILPCEQNCSNSIMRREMDRHCITVCPMKLVKCPFYSVGCQSTIPQCTIDQHRSENLHSHLLCILQGFHKEASKEDLKERVEELEKSSSSSSAGRLESARDARSLTIAIKDLDAKLGPIVSKTNANPPEDDVVTTTDTDLELVVDEKDSTGGSPIKKVVESPRKNDDSKEEELPTKMSAESQTNNEEVVVDNTIFIQESLKEPSSPLPLPLPLHIEEKDQQQHSPTKVEVQMANEEVVVVEEHSEKKTESAPQNEVSSSKSPHGNEHVQQSNRLVAVESPNRQNLLSSEVDDFKD
ncbi:hypothetical protein ACJIZ3_025882 [Penstemon smallii]|uniref:TRAF-type domain-containing protein n=1 Tax=Penstemon smallii TaxID=265156 RepID=A0ABD3TXL1_9LAMI